MKVILYTTHCPRCKVLEMKLKEKHIKYVECTNIEEMQKLGMMSSPYLKVDDKLFNFTDAINWTKEQ